MVEPVLLDLVPAKATATGLDEKAAATVAHLTINRPHKSNALDLATLRAFAQAVQQAGTNASVRALVVTGAGERAFVAGADINTMAALNSAKAREFITAVHDCCHALRTFQTPVIARINGVVFGAGLELAASADLLVAVSDAKFGMPEVKLGIPSVVEAAVLPGIVGWARTREMLLLGETFDAETALEWGLVHRVVAREALDDVVTGWLGSLFENGPRAVRDQKRLMRKWERLAIDDAVAAGVDAFAQSWQHEEPRLMMQAYVNRKSTKPT